MKEYQIAATPVDLDRNNGTSVMASSEREAVDMAWRLKVPLSPEGKYHIRTPGEADAECTYLPQRHRKEAGKMIAIDSPILFEHET